MNIRSIVGSIHSGMPVAARWGTILAFAIGSGAHPALAQMQTVDPDNTYSSGSYQQSGAIDGDLQGELPPVSSSGVTGDPYAAPAQSAPQTPAPVDPYYPPAPAQTPAQTGTYPSDAAAYPATTYPAEQAAEAAAADPEASKTYQKDDLIGAAQGVFGKGAEGVAGLIEKILKDQGEPNAYIVGREAGGAFAIGLRYGSGTLHHKVEGERDVYWTGPSIGFDVGAEAASTFVLVYNLWDSEELYERYPAGEGQLYVVGGLNASYMRKGDVVIIPIRMGVGARVGINAGYMKFSKKQRWLPF